MPKFGTPWWIDEVTDAFMGWVNINVAVVRRSRKGAIVVTQVKPVRRLLGHERAFGNRCV